MKLSQVARVTVGVAIVGALLVGVPATRTEAGSVGCAVISIDGMEYPGMPKHLCTYYATGVTEPYVANVMGPWVVYYFRPDGTVRIIAQGRNFRTGTFVAPEGTVIFAAMPAYSRGILNVGYGAGTVGAGTSLAFPPKALPQCAVVTLDGSVPAFCAYQAPGGVQYYSVTPIGSAGSAAGGYWHIVLRSPDFQTVIVRASGTTPRTGSFVVPAGWFVDIAMIANGCCSFGTVGAQPFT